MSVTVTAELFSLKNPGNTRQTRVNDFTKFSLNFPPSSTCSRGMYMNESGEMSVDVV